MNGSYPVPPKIKGYRPPSQACPAPQPTPRLQRSPATAWPVPMAEPLLLGTARKAETALGPEPRPARLRHRLGTKDACCMSQGE